MNKYAQELGRLGKGKKKRLTEGQRKKLAERLAIARKSRWKKKTNSNS